MLIIYSSDLGQHIIGPWLIFHRTMVKHSSDPGPMISSS